MELESLLCFTGHFSKAGDTVHVDTYHLSSRTLGEARYVHRHISSALNIIFSYDTYCNFVDESEVYLDGTNVNYEDDLGVVYTVNSYDTGTTRQ